MLFHRGFRLEPAPSAREVMTAALICECLTDQYTREMSGIPHLRLREAVSGAGGGSRKLWAVHEMVLDTP